MTNYGPFCGSAKIISRFPDPQKKFPILLRKTPDKISVKPLPTAHACAYPQPCPQPCPQPYPQPYPLMARDHFNFHNLTHNLPTAHACAYPQPCPQPTHSLTHSLTHNLAHNIFLVKKRDTHLRLRLGFQAIYQEYLLIKKRDTHLRSRLGFQGVSKTLSTTFFLIKKRNTHLRCVNLPSNLHSFALIKKRDTHLRCVWDSKQSTKISLD